MTVEANFWRSPAWVLAANARLLKRIYNLRYSRTAAGRACAARYNGSEKGRARHRRHNVKRRNDPAYASYRAKKLVDDRRNHFFSYTRKRDEQLVRYPWLANNAAYSATNILFRQTGIQLNRTGAVTSVDFSQPRKRRSDEVRLPWPNVR
jgi:hypothetical protein